MNSSNSVPKRIQCFIDGFNLYHAVENLGSSHLKWMNLHTLMSHFIDPSKQEIAEIYYFSAYAKWLPDQLAKHHAFVKANEQYGVTPIMGHFKSKKHRCHSCGATWVGHEEKETDVNIALWLVKGAYENKYDEAFLVSRDSDLTPAVALVTKNFPNKKIKLISPPNAGHSKEMGSLVGQKNLASIKQIHLERSLLPEKIINKQTKQLIAYRPADYDPP